MLFSFLSTIGLYIASMIILRETFDVVYIFSGDVISKIMIITILCWAPFWFLLILYRRYFPETHEKV
jgi:hypothetical protein